MLQWCLSDVTVAAPDITIVAPGITIPVLKRKRVHLVDQDFLPQQARRNNIQQIFQDFSQKLVKRRRVHLVDQDFLPQQARRKRVRLMF